MQKSEKDVNCLIGGSMLNSGALRLRCNDIFFQEYSVTGIVCSYSSFDADQSLLFNRFIDVCIHYRRQQLN